MSENPKEKKDIYLFRGTSPSSNPIFMVGVILLVGLFLFFGSLTLFTFLTMLGFGMVYIWLTLCLIILCVVLIVVGLVITQQKRDKCCSKALGKAFEEENQ